MLLVALFTTALTAGTVYLYSVDENASSLWWALATAAFAALGAVIAMAMGAPLTGVDLVLIGSLPILARQIKEARHTVVVPWEAQGGNYNGIVKIAFAILNVVPLAVGWHAIAAISAAILLASTGHPWATPLKGYALAATLMSVVYGYCASYAKRKVSPHMLIDVAREIAKKAEVDEDTEALVEMLTRVGKSETSEARF